jgi:hypothetical protein
MPIRITNRGKLAWRAELLENVWILRNYAKTLEAVMQTGITDSALMRIHLHIVMWQE